MLPSGVYFLSRQRSDGQIFNFQTAGQRRPGIPVYIIGFIVNNIVSIIIPTFNEEANISVLLDSINRLKTNNLFSIEIIVVDNGSVDNTVQFAMKSADKVFTLPDYTISELRNYGAEQAKGGIIGFIDADCLPCPEWAIFAQESLGEDATVGVVGSFYAPCDNPGWVEVLWLKMRKNKKMRVKFLPAGNCSVRKEEFLKIGGFSPCLQTGEDYDLCLKYQERGFFVKNIPQMLSKHKGNAKSLIDLFKGELWYGQTMLQSLSFRRLSKPIIACCLILTGLIFILTSLVVFFVSEIKMLLLFCIGVFLIASPVVAYALVATIRSRKVVYFFPYTLIFSFYLGGRLASLYYALSGKRKKIK